MENNYPSQKSPEYTERLDKALTLIRQLEIDKAMKLFYQLLEDNACDLELIQRIYQFEKKRPAAPGFTKICLHIFGLTSQSSKVNQLVVQTYIDYKSKLNQEPHLSTQQLFNLFRHITQSHLHKEIEFYRNKLKEEHAEHLLLPELLKHDCEMLFANKKYIQGKKEVQYLMNYYAETDAGRWAMEIVKKLL